MLTLFSRHAHPNCDGIGRRDFLKIGGLGLGGFGLPQLLAARATRFSAPFRALVDSLLAAQ